MALNHIGTFQDKVKAANLALVGTAEKTGIGLYETKDESKTEFEKLN